MLRIGLSVFAIAVLAAVIGPASAGEADTWSLRITKAKLAFRPDNGAGEPRQAIKLSGKIRKGALETPFSPVLHAFELWIGDSCALACEPGDGATWKSRGQRYRGRARNTAGCPGRAKISLNVSTGAFKIKAARLDLEAIRNGGTDDCEVRLRIGETDLTETISLDDLGKRWRYLAPLSVNTNGGWPGGGGGNNGGGNNGGGNVPRVVANGVRTAFGVPPWSPTSVVQSESTWKSMWAGAFSGSAPYVNFTNEMVVAVWVPGDQFTIFDITKQGSGLLVRYQTMSIPPPLTKPPTQPKDVYRAVAVERVSGGVTFQLVP